MFSILAVNKENQVGFEHKPLLPMWCRPVIQEAQAVVQDEDTGMSLALDGVDLRYFRGYLYLR